MFSSVLPFTVLWLHLLVKSNYYPKLSRGICVFLAMSGSSTPAGGFCSPCWMPATPTLPRRPRRWSLSTGRPSASGRTPLWLVCCRPTGHTLATTQTVSLTLHSDSSLCYTMSALCLTLLILYSIFFYPKLCTLSLVQCMATELCFIFFPDYTWIPWLKYSIL